MTIDFDLADAAAQRIVAEIEHQGGEAVPELARLQIRLYERDKERRRAEVDHLRGQVAQLVRLKAVLELKLGSECPPLA